MTVKLFVCYSRSDFEYVQTFLRQFERLTREEVFLWSDEQIAPSEDWEAKIHAALASAMGAVLFISPAFFQSEYIQRTELPALLRAQGSRGLRLYPMYVDESEVQDRLYARFDRVGDQLDQERPLTQLQGLNQPSLPLRGQEPAARSSIYRAAADLLWHDVKKRDSVSYDRPTPDRTVDIRLARVASSEVQASYRSDGEAIDCTFDVAKALAAVRDDESLEQHPRELLDLLFGPNRECFQRVANALEASVRSRVPADVAWRIRIRTEDPELLALPWRRASDSSVYLSERGWSFELCRDADEARSRDVSVAHPLRALLLLPTPPNARQREDAHARDLKEILRDLSWDGTRPAQPATVEIVHVASSLAGAIKRTDPTVVYALGRMRAPSGAGAVGGPQLLMATDSGGKAWVDLARALAPCRALAFVLLHEVVTEADERTSAAPLGAELLDRSAAVLHAAYGRFQAKNARAAAGTLLTSVLGASAPHLLANQTGAARWSLWSRYAEWSVERHEHHHFRHRIRLELDRIHQRREFRERLERFSRGAGVDDASVRILVLTAVGGSLDGIDQLPGLFVEHLRSRREDTPVQCDEESVPVPAAWSEGTPLDRAALDAALASRLGLATTDPGWLFGWARNGRPATAPGQRRIPLISTHLDAEADDARCEQLLEAWLELLENQGLRDSGGAEVTLVVLLTFQVEGLNRESVEHRLRKFRGTRSSSADASRLHLEVAHVYPLARVREEEVEELLDDSESRCVDRAQIEAVARTVIERSQGEFEPTVQLLEEGYDGGWESIMQSLEYPSAVSAAEPADPDWDY